jgi:hypothetical protein
MYSFRVENYADPVIIPFIIYYLVKITFLVFYG